MATIKQEKVFVDVLENAGKPVSVAMQEAGYQPTVSKDPQRLTRSKGWKELMDKYLPEKDIAKAHKGLLNSRSVGHMTFPNSVDDGEIKQLLKGVNCEIKKIAHGDNGTHVWYFTPDNKARKDAIDMAYKLRGEYENGGDGGGNKIIIVTPIIYGNKSERGYTVEGDLVASTETENSVGG